MKAQTLQITPTLSVRKPRVVRSKETWQHLINQFEPGSQTQADFCREHGISPMSFYKWRKRLSSDCINEHFIDISQSMVSVEAIDKPSSTRVAATLWQVELELGQGMILRVRTA